jgi:hypothetical protein
MACEAPWDRGWVIRELVRFSGGMEKRFLAWAAVAKRTAG